MPLTKNEYTRLDEDGYLALEGIVDPRHVARMRRRLIRVMNTRKKALHGSRVLIVGIAYKANAEDARDSRMHADGYPH